jgi:hypothetical protein
MVFMGGTLRLSGREGFSNPDRSVEASLAAESSTAPPLCVALRDVAIDA